MEGTNAKMTNADPPLRGIRVLDLSTMIAAPIVSSLLADYGAEVVKIERPGTGDHVRNFGYQADGQGLYWKTLSRGKKSVALDLHLPEVQQLVRDWVPQFDILVENFRPGTLDRWNLAPTRLRQLAPRLILLQVTAYGQQGPYRDRHGFGTLAEAMSGLVHVAAEDGERPRLPPYALADVLAGHLGAAAVLAALERRHRTGRGDLIDLALYESGLKLAELEILHGGRVARGQTSDPKARAAAAPRGTYLCSDGHWVAMAASTQEIAQRVLVAIGGRELIDDPRFATNEGRLEHFDELDELVASWCADRNREMVIAILTAAGGAVGPVESPITMRNNPQIVARGSLQDVDDPDLGRLTMTNVFPRFAESGPLPVPPPGAKSVGHDTREVLRRDLALTDEDFARLGIE